MFNSHTILTKVYRIPATVYKNGLQNLNTIIRNITLQFCNVNVTHNRINQEYYTRGKDKASIEGFVYTLTKFSRDVQQMGL